MNQNNCPFLSVRESCRTGCKRTVSGSLKLFRFEPTGLVRLDIYGWRLTTDDLLEMVSLHLCTQSCAVFHGGLFVALYIADVTLIAQRHRVAVHSVADGAPTTQHPMSAAQLLHCITNIADCMTSNRL